METITHEAEDGSYKDDIAEFYFNDKLILRIINPSSLYSMHDHVFIGHETYKVARVIHHLESMKTIYNLRFVC